MDTSLLVFGKMPRPGSVKTRLTTTLTPAEAARLYTAFLRDTLRKVVPLEVTVRLYLAPPLPDGGMDGLPTEVSVHAQEGDGLGERMRQAVQETLSEGADRAVVMGSDHPTLPSSFLQQAFRTLDHPQSICIGPTEDGGFYLLGMTSLYPQLFEDMTYSHSDVFSETVSRAEQTEAEVTVLPEWYDVDTPRDLSRLRADLANDTIVAPNTRRMVDRLNLDVTSEDKCSGSSLSSS